MTKTVTIAATRTNGDPYAHHDVIVTLVAGSAGGVVGSNVIVESSTVKLDADGEGSLVLETNEAITSPATSFYRFTVEGSSPTITRSIRLTDDLPSSVSWTLAGIQVGDPTIPQRDVSSDYVTISDQSLTNYLASRTSAGFTVPMVGQWNVGGDQVLSLLAQFTDISPYFGTPSTDVDITPGPAVDGDVSLADIPNDWIHLPPAVPAESYVGFNLSVGVVESVVGLDTPFWGRNIYTWDSEWTSTVHFFYRDGFPADSTSDVRVAIIADGITYEGTVPGAAVGETGDPLSIPFPLRALPPKAGQQIITGDTNVTGIEGTIVNNGPDGTAITAVLPRPAPGTELVIVTGADDGVFDADGDDLVVAATGATTSTYALPARSVVTLGFLDGSWTVLDDTSTGGGGGVALGETSTTAYRGDRGKTAYDHSQVVTGNPHGTTAADVGAQPVDSDLTAIAALTTTSYGRAFLALADAAAGRTALGLGTAALSATGDYATAAHTHTGTYQPLDSDLTSIAALTTTSFGRALLELADATAARTAIGAMASTTALPWQDDVTVLHVVRDPLPVTGTYTYSPGSLRGGGYIQTQSGSGWSLTYARLPLRAGTYTRRFLARTDNQSGIVTFTIGGISAGTADCYSGSAVNDVVFDATGIVIPADGFYDLVLTSTTKNGSSAAYRANAQFTRLFRTGA